MCYPTGMTYQLIQYEIGDGVAQITLNRPEKLNAWTPQMAVEQADALQRANDDRSVGAVVMTGAGRAFCAGADMELTFKSRIEGRDPGEDTASGQGGMPDRLVEPEKLVEAARELAREIAANPDPQLRMTKALLTQNASATDLDEVQRRESEMLRACWKSPEHAEAVQAFLDKRPSRFR